jgi:hypothetical protein
MTSVACASTDEVDSGAFANGQSVGVVVVAVVVVVAAFIVCLLYLLLFYLFIYLFPSNYLNITIITIPIT